MALTLVIGNKNYSSWSFRPWIALRMAGVPFEEVVIPLYEPGSKERILSFSPAGKVPVLVDGDLRVWESLAIIDYLAERFPQAELWPKDPAARAHARAIAAEMHAGFAPLRRHCPMNMWRSVKVREVPPEVAADVKRIEAIFIDKPDPVINPVGTKGIEVDPRGRVEEVHGIGERPRRIAEGVLSAIRAWERRPAP